MNISSVSPKLYFSADQNDDAKKPPSSNLDDSKPVKQDEAPKGKSNAKKNGAPDYNGDDLKEAGLIVGGITVAAMAASLVGGFFASKFKKGGGKK